MTAILAQEGNQVGLCSRFLSDDLPALEGIGHRIDLSLHFCARPPRGVVIVRSVPLLLRLNERIGDLMQVTRNGEFWTGDGRWICPEIGIQITALFF